jgi:hypothetical protein
MSVLFDQLRISDDGKRMYINIHVNKAEYFDNIYLDRITIVPADKVSETSPHLPSTDYIYNKVFEENQKEADLVLLPTDFNEKFVKTDFSHDLFFVYVKVNGTPDPCTPCRLDEEITLGVTFDENLLYQKVMQFTKSLADDCNIPVAFTDFILLWNAFKASVETEHYVPAIKYWNMLFGMDAEGIPYGAYDKNSGVIHKLCGCHG